MLLKWGGLSSNGKLIRCLLSEKVEALAVVSSGVVYIKQEKDLFLTLKSNLKTSTRTG